MRVAHDYSTRGDDASRNRLLLPKVLRTAKWPYHEETTRFHLSIAFLIWDVGKIAWKKLQWINLTFLGILKFTNHTQIGTSHLRVVKQRIKEHAHLSGGGGGNYRRTSAIFKADIPHFAEMFVRCEFSQKRQLFPLTPSHSDLLKIGSLWSRNGKPSAVDSKRNLFLRRPFPLLSQLKSAY